MKALEADIVIVGAGLVGLSAAIAFSQQGKSVVLLDANQMDANKAEIKKSELSFLKSWDARIYALTPASENWLKSLGVWQHVDAARVNEINAMHLWHEGAESPLILADSDANIARLGVVAESQNLHEALKHALKANSSAGFGASILTAACKSIENGEKNICLTLADNTKISAKLLVAADGANSFVRQQMGIATKQKAFNQTAIVANFACEKPHKNSAQQWFGAHETMALLPLVGQNVSLVWSLSTEQAQALLLLDAADLAARVAQRCDYALGALQPLGGAISFPLCQTTATQLIANRVALVGDAAHQVHPMAGQGVNLGFRDVVALQDLLAKAHAMQDIGEQSFLRKYERARKADIISISGLTSGLDQLFASEQDMLKTLTSFGMRQLSEQKLIKKMMIKQAVA